MCIVNNNNIIAVIIIIIIIASNDNNMNKNTKYTHIHINRIGYCCLLFVLLKVGRVLLTEILLPRIARQGAVCPVSIRGQARTTRIERFELDEGFDLELLDRELSVIVRLRQGTNDLSL